MKDSYASHLSSMARVDPYDDRYGLLPLTSTHPLVRPHRPKEDGVTNSSRAKGKSALLESILDMFMAHKNEKWGGKLGDCKSGVNTW